MRRAYESLLKISYNTELVTVSMRVVVKLFLSVCCEVLYVSLPFRVFSCQRPPAFEEYDDCRLVESTANSVRLDEMLFYGEFFPVTR